MLLRRGGAYALCVSEFSAAHTAMCAYNQVPTRDSSARTLGEERPSWRHTPHHQLASDTASTPGWIDDAILHHAAHHIDLLLHWFGDVTPVASVAHPKIEGAQDAALVATLPNRAPVNLSVSYTSRLQETRLTVVGTGHTVTTDGFGFIQSDHAEFAWESNPQECYERAIQLQDRAFIEACSGGPGGVPWEETVRLAECLDLFGVAKEKAYEDRVRWHRDHGRPHGPQSD